MFHQKIEASKKGHFSSTFDSKYFVNKQKTENQNNTPKSKTARIKFKSLIKLFYLHTGNENTITSLKES